MSRAKSPHLAARPCRRDTRAVRRDQTESAERRAGRATRQLWCCAPVVRRHPTRRRRRDDRRAVRRRVPSAHGKNFSKSQAERTASLSLSREMRASLLLCSHIASHMMSHMDCSFISKRTWYNNKARRRQRNPTTVARVAELGPRRAAHRAAPPHCTSHGHPITRRSVLSACGRRRR